MPLCSFGSRNLNSASHLKAVIFTWKNLALLRLATLSALSHLSAGVLAPTRDTMMGIFWSAPPFTLKPNRPFSSGAMVMVTRPDSEVGSGPGPPAGSTSRLRLVAGCVVEAEEAEEAVVWLLPVVELREEKVA